MVQSLNPKQATLKERGTMGLSWRVSFSMRGWSKNGIQDDSFVVRMGEMKGREFLMLA